MKPDAWRNVAAWRIREGRLASGDEIRNNGAFMIPWGGKVLSVIASDGLDWDHVSVSMPDRCPSWEQMCFIKDLFFDPEEAVMQLHPPKSDHVNHHKFCLHLWRPQVKRIPLPPSILVGPKQ